MGHVTLRLLGESQRYTWPRWEYFGWRRSDDRILGAWHVYRRVRQRAKWLKMVDCVVQMLLMTRRVASADSWRQRAASRYG
jgi:hypothetical protein